MRNIFPIIFATATVLVGCCHSHSMANTQTAPPVATTPVAPAPTVVTQAVAAPTMETQAVAASIVLTQAVATPIVETQAVVIPTIATQAVATPAAPASIAGATAPAPSDSFSENVILGDIGAVFILILTIAALRSR